MMDNTAFLDGYDAYWEGADPDDNPYAGGDNDHFLWEQGWSQAQMEDVEEPPQ
jgi:hypothetical protein